MDNKSIWTNSIDWLAIMGCKGATSGFCFPFQTILALINIQSSLLMHAWSIKSFSDQPECSNNTLVTYLVMTTIQNLSSQM